MLHFDYECQVLSHILSLIEENSWTFHKIPLRETLSTLENLEPRLVLMFIGVANLADFLSIFSYSQ